MATPSQAAVPRLSFPCASVDRHISLDKRTESIKQRRQGGLGIPSFVMPSASAGGRIVSSKPLVPKLTIEPVMSPPVGARHRGVGGRDLDSPSPPLGASDNENARESPELETPTSSLRQETPDVCLSYPDPRSPHWPLPHSQSAHDLSSHSTLKPGGYSPVKLKKDNELMELSKLDFGVCGDEPEQQETCAELPALNLSASNAPVPRGVPKLSLSGALSQGRDGGMFDPKMQVTHWILVGSWLTIDWILAYY